MRYRDFKGVCGEEDSNYPFEEYRQWHREVEATKQNFIRASVPDPDRNGTRIRDTKLSVPSPDGEHPLRHLVASEILAGVSWIIHSRFYKPEYQDDTRRLSSRSRPYLPFALKRQADYRRDYRRGETLPIQVFCTDCPMPNGPKWPNGHWLSGYNRAESIMDGRGYVFEAGMVLEFRGLTLDQHNHIDYQLNTEHGFPLAAMDSCLMALNYIDGGMPVDEAYEIFAQGTDTRSQFDDGLLGAMLFKSHDKDVDFLNRIDKNGGHSGRSRTPGELGRNVKAFGRTSISAFLDHGKSESKRRWMMILNDKTGISGALGGGNGFMGKSLESALGYNINVKFRSGKTPDEKWAIFEQMLADFEAVMKMRSGLEKARKTLKKEHITEAQEMQEILLACSKFINLIGSHELRKLRASMDVTETESLARSTFLLGDVFGDLLEDEGDLAHG